MTDGDVVVPLVGVADVTRGFEEVQVIGAAVVGEPEVPYPRVRQSQHCVPFVGAASRQPSWRRRSAAASGTTSLANAPIPDSDPARYFSLPGARLMVNSSRCNA